MKKSLNNKLLAVISAVVVFSPFSGASAETLQEAVLKVLGSHDRIQAAKADFAAFETRVHEAFANNWTPQFELTTHVGAEAQSSQASGANSELYSRELDLKLTQRLWDWGQGTALVQAAEQTKKQYEAGLIDATQVLTLDAVVSYINLKRTEKMVQYAKDSIVNIKRQGKVEDARVALGKGYSSDVLQVKAQLAGAETRLADSRGALLQARNHIRTVFMRDPNEISKLKPSQPLFKILPKTLDEVVAYTHASNLSAKQLAYTANMMSKQADSTRIATFYPVINAILEHKLKEGVGGVDEFERETFAKVEVTFPFNLGLSGFDAIEAANKDAEAARLRYQDNLLQVTELARTAWDNLATVRVKAKLLAEQADLAEKFLELAREERKLDKRTLLDVLNGETALINSRSDAASAKADVQIAFYTLIQTMGALSPELLAEDAHKRDLKLPALVATQLDSTQEPLISKSEVVDLFNHQ
ncbi:MAG: TolC family protein [Magnetococcales bacterium]|nr:TolC family protein [Magnetococcales bacterium]